MSAGRLLHYTFRGCSAFTHVTACTLAKSPQRRFTPEAPAVSLPPPPAPIATGWSESVPGRDFHPLWTSTFSRGTTFRLLIRPDISCANDTVALLALALLAQMTKGNESTRLWNQIAKAGMAELADAADSKSFLPHCENPNSTVIS
jgi:hypothetical protein